eukprot:scaffold42752_cov30-Phaeocystis_antarctica.AAC.2
MHIDGVGPARVRGPAPRATWKARRGGARGQCSRPTAATACVTAAPCRGRWCRHQSWRRRRRSPPVPPSAGVAGRWSQRSPNRGMER